MYRIALDGAGVLSPSVAGPYCPQRNPIIITRKPTKETGRKKKNERKRRRIRRRRVVSRHVSSFNDDDIITVVISDGFRVHPLPHGRSPSSHSYSFSFYLVHHDWNIRNPIVSESIRNFTPDWKRMKDILKFRAFSFSFFRKSKEKRQWKETKECRNKRLWPFLLFFSSYFYFFLPSSPTIPGWMAGCFLVKRNPTAVTWW
jgi:hypothetical protein